MLMFRVLLCLLLFSCPAAALAGINEWAPFETVDGEFVLQVQVNGIETKAALALDSLANSINTSFLEQQGIRFDKHARYDLVFMGTNLEMSRLDDHEGDPDIGLRFQPWFESAPIFQVDYANRRLRFLSNKAVKLYGQDNVEINKRTNDLRSLAAVVEVDGNKYSFATAYPRATFTTVSRDVALESGWLEKYKISLSRLGQAGADLENYDAMLVPDVVFGPFEFEYLIVLAYKKPKYANRVVTDLNNTALLTFNYDGVLGLDVLNNFVITYDHHRRKIHVGVP